MNEIELFFKIAESEIRNKHINFLKGEKCLPDGEPPKEVISAADLKKYEKMRFCWVFDFIKRFRYVKRLRLIKRYNKGIETALKVLQREYKRFNKRLEKENNS